MTTEQLNILFGSKTRVKLLKHFLADPAQKYYVRELTRMLNDHINAIRHELGNLEKADLVTKKKSQGKLYYRLNQGTPGMHELKKLFTEPKEEAAPASEAVAAPAPQAQPSGMYVAPGGSQAPAAASTAPKGAEPDVGDVVLMVQNGKFVSSTSAPSDLLVVGEVDDDLFAAYLADLEEKHGEVRYTVMTESEFTYRRQLFDRFITLMLSEPKKLVINRLRDRDLARA
jgi:hypothetical protein